LKKIEKIILIFTVKNPIFAVALKNRPKRGLILAII